MNYTNIAIRRQDRLLPETEALEILKTAEYGVLSMVSLDGTGYGIPVNYVWDGCQAIYFHCAPQGQKLENLTVNAKVSFCVVGNTNVVADKFTTQYESVIVKGSVCLSLTDDQKMEALKMILNKYSSEYMQTGLKYTEKSLHRTAIIRLDIESASGKCKR